MQGLVSFLLFLHISRMTKGFLWDHGVFSGGLICLTTSSGIPTSLVWVLTHLENGGVTCLFPLTHSRQDLFIVFDCGFGQVGDISGIVLVKEYFKKSN